MKSLDHETHKGFKMFDITETIFRECLQEAITESLPEGSTEQDRQALLSELATRWNFNPEMINHD